jgi:hypothetical protein
LVIETCQSKCWLRVQNPEISEFILGSEKIFLSQQTVSIEKPKKVEPDLSFKVLSLFEFILIGRNHKIWLEG